MCQQAGMGGGKSLTCCVIKVSSGMKRTVLVSSGEISHVV